MDDKNNNSSSFLKQVEDFVKYMKGECGRQGFMLVAIDMDCDPTTDNVYTAVIGDVKSVYAAFAKIYAAQNELGQNLRSAANAAMLMNLIGLTHD